MKLTATEKWMAEKLDAKGFDTYALLVGIGDSEKLITSPNADGDTIFDIASCGKMLHTAPLILHAIGEGRLTLDATLDEFFRDVPEEKRKITVRQLLTHTSGILRITLPKEICAQGNDAIAKCILEEPLAFRPGTDYIYSCNGMILLGFILESIYGKTLEQLFIEVIREPLGMTRSAFFATPGKNNTAVCYTRREMGELPFDDGNILNIGHVAGSGGSFFTANDIQKYVKAILRKDERLYPKALYDLAEQDYSPFGVWGRGLGYTYIDRRYNESGHLFPDGSFGHTGWTGQSIFINRELQMYVILLTNAARYRMIQRDFRYWGFRDSVAAMRYQIHDRIRKDLLSEGLLQC